jgi:hypothetical protein
MTSAPPTENASAPMAAPLMKARRCMSSMIFPPVTFLKAILRRYVRRLEPVKIQRSIGGLIKPAATPRRYCGCCSSA